MSSEIVETRGNYRAVKEIDEGASPPDGDYFGTVIEMGRGGPCEVLGHAYGVKPDDFGLRYLWERWGDMVMIERYLRMWTDVVGFDYFDTRDAKYVNVVTKADLKMWGWDEDPATWPYPDPAKNNLVEWQAWVEGDVWVLHIEKNVTWSTDDEDFEDHDDWSTLDDTYLGGYYGDYSDEAAKEMLDDYAPRPCKICGEALKRDESQQPPWPWVHVESADHEAKAV